MRTRPTRTVALATAVVAVGVSATFALSLVTTSAAAASAGSPPVPNSLHEVGHSRQSAVAPASRSNNAVKVLEVHPATGTSSSTLLRRLVTAAGAFAGAKLRNVTGSSTVQVQVPAADASALTARLAGLAGVRDVTNAAPRYVSAIPNDPLYAGDQATYLNAIDAPAAWDITQGSPTVTVAVIDTGVDVNHPDLVGKIAGTYNAVDGSNSVTDAIGHGTFVAGIIAAATDNSVGVAGVGWNTKILAVKVADSDGTIYSSYIASGINWAVAHGAQVINISLGGQQADSTEELAIANAQSHGVLVVAAAGNCGGTDYASEGCTVRNPVTYPAAQSGVLSVAALTQSGSAVADFSETGSWVSLAAPGQYIASTTPTAGSELFPAPDYTPYARGDGTSFASPLVAGAAALLRAQYPSATMSTIREALEDTARPMVGKNVGHGELDIAAALAGLLSAGSITTPSPASVLTGTATLGGTTAAPAARFLVDGAAVGSLMIPVGGTVSTTWSTAGWANGTHTVTLVNCATSGGCVSTGASEAVTVSNALPTIATASAGAYVDGTISFSGMNANGAMALVVDGVVRARTAASPWTVALATSDITDGAHQARMVACSVDLTRCAGAMSAVVAFSSYSSRIDVYRSYNSTFSPNGDGVRDSTEMLIYLPGTESTAVTILNSAGTVVFGPTSMGNLPKGYHPVYWDGTYSSSFAHVPDGSYVMRITTAWKVGSAVKRAYVALTLRVDTKPAVLTDKTESTTSFYPHKNATPTTFTAALTSNESGTLTLVVAYANHSTAVRLSGARNAGRSGITWNGLIGPGTFAARGTYRWELLFVDAAGNASSDGWSLVSVR